MAATPNITAGIKAIKIAKEDALSNDISVQLQEAKVLRIAFDDIGIQQFDIISIAEYSNYYLYYVKPQNIGNRLSTFNLPVDSSTGGVGGSGFVNTDGNMLVSAYPQYTGFIRTVANSNKSVLSYSSGTGIFQTPAQKQPYAIKASFTASIFSSNNNAGNIRFYVSSSAGGGIGTPGINIPTPANISGSSNAVTISGSIPGFVFDPLSVEDFGFRFINYYGSNTFYMPTSSLQITIESYVTSSTDTNGVTTVLEPYASEDVANSDYNVIMNNAVEGRFNAFYMDVDYSSNAIVAVNQQAILDGSATRAQVQYSNYTTARITNPRYYGSKNTSPDVNVGEGNLEPAVESDGTYFAYFDWVGGTTAEVINKAGFHIKYLIDSNANVYTPNLTSSYYYNLIDSFNANGNNVNVVFNEVAAGNNVDNLVGVHPVIRPGALARAIIFSQTGSVAGAASNISFTTGVAHNYGGTANLSPNSYIPNTTYTIGLSTVAVTPPDLNFNTTGEYAAVITTDTEINIIPRFSLNLTYLDEIRGYDGQAVITIQKSTNAGSTWNTYFSQTVPLYNGNTGTTQISGPAEPAVSGSLYRGRITFNGVPTSPGADLTLNSGTFTIIQDPSYGGTATSGSGNLYWTTGSSSQNILTGSQFNSNIYGGTQVPVVDSGYDSPYLPFTVQIGDEIRFQGNEASTRQIINVSPPTENPDNKLYLTLNSAPSLGTNLQSFLLRRYSPNPNFIIVDALKDSSTGGGSGFLMPEYASNDLITKFDEVIKTLTEKSLI